MTRSASLALLLIAQPAPDLESVEATLRAITERIDVLEPGSEDYAAAHARIDELLNVRAQLVSDRAQAEPVV